MALNHWKICLPLLALIALAGCVSNRPPAPTIAETPIQWGEPVGGLQVGIAAETSIAAFGQPRPPVPPVVGVKVYLRNQGQADLLVVDPTPSPNAEISTADLVDARPVALVTVIAVPGNEAHPVIPHLGTVRVRSLKPSEMIGVSVDLTSIVSVNTDNTTLPDYVAEYANADTEVTVAAPELVAGVKKVGGVWTGRARTAVLNTSPSHP
jgi:hypothetical protein